MSEQSNARLKSTGEPVMILASDGANPRVGSATSGYSLCLMPPQAPGHKRRFQWIRSERLDGR